MSMSVGFFDRGVPVGPHVRTILLGWWNVAKFVFRSQVLFSFVRRYTRGEARTKYFSARRFRRNPIVSCSFRVRPVGATPIVRLFRGLSRERGRGFPSVEGCRYSL